VDFFGESRIFFGKCLKKVVQKFRQKFSPPVSEGLDPLVGAIDTKLPQNQLDGQTDKLFENILVPVPNFVLHLENFQDFDSSMFS